MESFFRCVMMGTTKSKKATIRKPSVIGRVTKIEKPKLRKRYAGIEESFKVK